MSAQCSACLGSRKCWVCQGTGRIETSPDTYEVCWRCGGTGVCTVCGGTSDLAVPTQRAAATAGAYLEVGEDAVRIHAYGEFDIDSSWTLADALDDAARSGASVVLDLQDVSFIDMYALRSVIATTEELARAGRTLRVVNASPLISRLFRLTNLTDLLSA